MVGQIKENMYDDYLEEQADRGFISSLDATILQGASSDDDFVARRL